VQCVQYPDEANKSMLLAHNGFSCPSLVLASQIGITRSRSSFPRTLFSDCHGAKEVSPCRERRCVRALSLMARLPRPCAAVCLQIDHHGANQGLHSRQSIQPKALSREPAQSKPDSSGRVESWTACAHTAPQKTIVDSEDSGSKLHPCFSNSKSGR
jgi:hypothetical protein